jgi:hypothetical protein
VTATLATGAPSASASSESRRQARAHGRMVKTLRWLLPALALAIFASLAGFVIADAVGRVVAHPAPAPSQIEMVNPRVLGRDDHGRPFTLTARLARRDEHDLEQVILLTPVLTIDLGGPRLAILSADRGVFRDGSHLLKMIGHVRVNDAKAAGAATDEALVDTKAGTVTGLGPIAGANPNGEIQAKSYTATDQGDRVFLKGGVHAVLRGGLGGGK